MGCPPARMSVTTRILIFLGSQPKPAFATSILGGVQPKMDQIYDNKSQTEATSLPILSPSKKNAESVVMFEVANLEMCFLFSMPCLSIGG